MFLRILLLFGIAGLILYSTALDSVFTYDDAHQILQNSSIRSLTGIPSFFTDIATGSRSPVETLHYRPVLLSTFAINYALGGLNPIGYHLVNLAFHVGTAFLVFLIVNLMLTSFYAGLAAGLVMLFHPFNSEVVNYVTARSSVMAVFFYLLAFYAYVRYRQGIQEPAPITKIAGDRRWVYLSWAAFGLGMLTKEILITLPLILILYEYVLHTKISVAHPPPHPLPSRVGINGKGNCRSLALVIAPFIAIPLGYMIIKKLVVGVVGPVAVARGLVENILIQVKVLASTWQMLIAPINLSIEHPVPMVKSVRDLTFVGALVLLVVLLAAMLWFWRSRHRALRVIGFFLAWFYVTLLPTTIIPLTAVLQENRGYIASVAFAGIIGALVLIVESLLQTRRRVVFVSVIGLILILYSIGVWDRNRVWGSEVTLWQDAIRKSPSSYGPHFGMGSAYQRQGRLDQAEVEYLRALEIEDKDPVLHNDLGALYNETNRPDEALRQFEEAIRINPEYDLAYSNMGLLYSQNGRTGEAVQSFEAATRLNPFNETALINLGTIYQQGGHQEKAIGLYTRTLSRNPNLPGIQMQMGIFYQQQGDHEPAIRSFEKVVSLNPSYADAYIALGKEYLTIRRPREAIHTFQQAVTLQPEDGFGYLTLGKLYEQLGESVKARDLYKKVLTLDPAKGRNQTAISLARNELERFR
ncbi:MAG: tetratricopeptide repeat protein [Nitrospirae bacterium]|nr:tetratricopeptide repeat protein [Nitrospirota bacterium]